MFGTEPEENVSLKCLNKKEGDVSDVEISTLTKIWKMNYKSQRECLQVMDV